jgi:succinylglutamate desuccinylase
VFVVGGVHGNEPAGFLAAERVLAQLADRRPPMRGRLVAVGGNLRALARRQRYIESDLNRIWREEVVARIHQQERPADAPEEGELREMIDEFQRHLEQPHERAVFLDLHTMSAGGAPFQCMGDTMQNRHVAYELPVPLILGLEEVISGSLLEYVGDRGHVAIAVEGGQHTDPRTVEHHEAAVWVALVAADLLTPDEVPDLERHRARLAAASRGVPHVVEIRYRHGVADGDGFAMRPGFHNFQPVRRDELLAQDRTGEIRSPMDGLLLLPRYQGQGNDGFFLAREVRPVWLRVSAFLRRVRAERLLTLLPGVRRLDPSRNRIAVDARIARVWPVEVFHLFGYRRTSAEPGRLVFERRREGPPWPRRAEPRRRPGRAHR